MQVVSSLIRVRLEVTDQVWAKLRIRAIQQRRSVSEVVDEILAREVKDDQAIPLIEVKEPT